MEIRFAVMEGGDSSPSHKFLFPLNRVFDDNQHRGGFAIGINQQTSEDFPDFDTSALESKEKLEEASGRIPEVLGEDPVLDRRGSDRILTPTPEELGASGSAGDSVADSGEASGDLEVSAGDLFSERIADVFSDTTPGAHKVTLRPRSVRRAEEAAAGVARLKPLWDAFAEHFGRHRIEVQRHCAQWAHGEEKSSSAA
jgi:hypothetical protein